MKHLYTWVSRTLTGNYKPVLDRVMVTLVLWSGSGLLLMLIMHGFSAFSGQNMPGFMPICSSLTYLLLGLLGLCSGVQRLIEEKHSGNSIVFTITIIGGSIFLLLSGVTLLVIYT